MRIPIDRYSLLGVSLGAGCHIILNQLERRLEKSEYSGFTGETQEKRIELLKENTSILLNEDKRKAYESDYLSTRIVGDDTEPTIEIKDDYEIAGLLLLLESGEVEECLRIAEQVFRQKRLDMNYFSADFKDLNKIIDYATLGYANKLKSKRYYETASEVLGRRIKSHSVGMGDKEIINIMATELEQLLPFRVLDMLSRANDEQKHLIGIDLLTRLVAERGGLDNNSNKYMNNDEFHAFFRQIRSYLTVQEQIDLYKKWASEGSKVGKFLHCIALVAQGFSQRKPNRIRDALDIMRTIATNELQPVVANMHLLLGDVENANNIFQLYADEQLKAWWTKKAEEPLGRLCEWCREWLERDVLIGYKDIDVGPDIDSYFSDKDVVSYIEGVDIQGEAITLRSTDYYQDKMSNYESFGHSKSEEKRANPENPRYTRERSWLVFTKEIIRNSTVIKENLLIFIIIAVSSCSLLLFTRVAPIDTRIEERSESIEKNQEKKDFGKKLSKDELVRESISKWLKLKKKALSEDKPPENANLIATRRLLKQLEAERRINQKKGVRQYIDASVKRIEIKEETPTKLRVVAELGYRDVFVNADGNIEEKTEQHTFERHYELIWREGKWLVDK